MGRGFAMIGWDVRRWMRRRFVQPLLSSGFIVIDIFSLFFSNFFDGLLFDRFHENRFACLSLQP
jgi:hypothetical protein